MRFITSTVCATANRTHSRFSPRPPSGVHGSSARRLCRFPRVRCSTRYLPAEDPSRQHRFLPARRMSWEVRFPRLHDSTAPVLSSPVLRPESSRRTRRARPAGCTPRLRSPGRLIHLRWISLRIRFRKRLRPWSRCPRMKMIRFRRNLWSLMTTNCLRRSLPKMYSGRQTLKPL